MAETSSDRPNTLLNAFLGAVVTVVLSFTMISPLLGGGLAGYLQREPPEGGLRVGAISGAIASIPFVLLVFGGMVMFVGMPGARMGVPGAPELLIIAFMFLLLTGWNVLLSAAGGYAGAYVRTRSGSSGGERRAPGQGA